MNKVCYKCGQEKDISCFYTRLGAKDKHRGECKVCSLAKEKYYRAVNPEVHRRIAKRSYQKHRVEYCQANAERKNKVRIEVLTYYGNGRCGCVRCGYTDVRALSIDHIDGGGRRHIKEIRGTRIAYWLKANAYPAGYQTLCMNCQFIKKIENGEQNKK